MVEGVQVTPELLAEVKIAAVEDKKRVLVEEPFEFEVVAMTGTERPGVRGRMKPGLGIRLGGAVRG